MFNLSVRRFDEFAAAYAEKFRNIDAYTAHIDRFCDRIGSARPAILELACGPGNVTRYVRQRFPDSDYLAIDLALAENGFRVIHFARQDYPEADGSVLVDMIWVCVKS